MKTIEKLKLYQAALRKWKAAKDIVACGLKEPQPEGFNLKSAPDKHMARTIREKVMEE